MAEVSERVQLVQAIFAGLKDLGLVAASVATIWIQAGNAGKLDIAAAKTDQVKEKLEASSEVRDQKLDHIAKAANSADATIRGWKAEYEKPKGVTAEMTVVP